MPRSEPFSSIDGRSPAARPRFVAALLALGLASGAHLARAAAGPISAPTPAARIVAPIDERERIELPGQVDHRVSASVDLGPVDSGASVDRLVLVLRGSTVQQADLQRFLRDVQARGRPAYHRWLDPAEFAGRFGIAAADRRRIRTWLEGHGMHLEAEPAGGRSLVLSGTYGALDAAFQTRFHRYRWHGESHVASAAPPTIPKAFAGVIAGFASLDDFRTQPQLVRSSVAPQFTSGGMNFMGPGDFATIYDLESLYAEGLNGAGRTIAVLGRSDVAATDLSNFRSFFALTASTPQTLVDGSDPGIVSGDEVESDLDIEWAGAIAPAATIKFVIARSTRLTDGIDLAAQYAVSNNLADIITVSYGGCENTGDVSGGTTFYNQLWEQAAAQGTSVFVASGDAGAAGCDTPTAATATHGLGVNALCTSPYSTCVGGTEFSADLGAPASYWSSGNTLGAETSALGYIAEAVWNQSGGNLYASGGGASIYFAKPAWQLAAGVPSDAHRDVPDLAFNASSLHDPYLIFTTDGYTSSTLAAIGGTSAGTPSMAGIAALVAQRENGRVGSFNPILYALSGQQTGNGAAVFHRITSGNNSVPGQAGFSASTSDPDYNQASGLGSIDGAALVAAWGEYLPSTAGIAPTTVTVPSGVAVGSVVLTLPATTAWSAVVGSGATSWLSITPASGTGPAALTYASSANASTSARTGTITIAGQALTVIQAAAAGTSGNAGQIATSAASLNFGAGTVGTVSTIEQLLIGDSGNASLTLGAISFGGGQAADFAETGSCASGVVLIPGAVCYLDVSFDPQASGAASADLKIDIGGTTAATIALAGTAALAAQPLDTDGPLPVWAYPLLAALLLARAARRHRNVSQI